MNSYYTKKANQQKLSVINFDIKVQIKEDLKKSLIFGLQARLPIGVILGFVGYRHHVLPIMQTLSHSTRAYIVNSDGLQGFVIAFDIINHLKKLDEAGRLEHARKWQVFDLWNVQSELETKRKNQQKMNHLQRQYPSLYVEILSHLEKDE